MKGTPKVFYGKKDMALLRRVRDGLRDLPPRPEGLRACDACGTTRRVERLRIPGREHKNELCGDCLEDFHPRCRFCRHHRMDPRVDCVDCRRPMCLPCREGWHHAYAKGTWMRGRRPRCIECARNVRATEGTE